LLKDIARGNWGRITLLGLMTGYTLGGVIHALLVIAIVVGPDRVIKGW
jgi:hypothetical protein